MRVLFYSTSSSTYDENLVSKTFPSNADELQKLALKYPEHEFIVATQLPGMFLLDLSGKEPVQKAKNIRYQIIQADKEDEIAQSLVLLNPDLAIAATFYTVPFDWLTAKDAIVAKKLESRGIRTICHSLETSIECFDKWRTHNLLKRLKINTPKAVYVHHELYINAGNRTFVKSNVYRTMVLEQIRELNFPLIIKDTTGFSSYGTDVLETFEETKNWLKSKKFTSDRIVEEFIKGENFGVEIIGKPKKDKLEYEIKPAFLFSVNRYGITSPKQSVKAGPVSAKIYRLRSLNRLLKRLAEGCRFKGIAQVDLVFDGKTWFVIEVNPRLSGMTTSYAAMEGKTLGERLLESAEFLLQSKPKIKTKILSRKKADFTLNIKLSLTDSKTENYEIKDFLQKEYIKKVYQIQNLAAKQIREKGYCEVILTGKTKKELLDNLEDLNNTHRQSMEESFYENAKRLIKKL